MTSRLLAWLLILTPLLAKAQEPILITGTVIDGTSNQPIINALVQSAIVEARTNENGEFSIAINKLGTPVKFEAEGYLDSTIQIESTEVEVQLFSNMFAETVEVVSGSEPVSERPSSTPIASTEVFEVAGSIDNIFRTLDTLPGVTSTDDFGSRLSVRGGTPDQNLTIMDGIEVHNPYRLFGITSAFNPETVDNFELTAGGFGVAYGDRLSSLLVVNNRPANSNFQGAAAVSVTDGNIVVEGPMPGPAQGSWLLSARRTYYDIVVGRIQNQDFPSFADVQLQTGWNFSSGHRLSLVGLRSRENANLDIEGNQENERAVLGSESSNDLISVRFDAVIGTRATSKTVVSSYRNIESLDFDGRFQASAKRSNSPTDAGFSFTNIAFGREITVRDTSVRQEFNLQASANHLVSTGIEFHQLRTGVNLSITGDRNETAANGSSIQGGAGLPDSLQSSLTGTRGGMWVQDTFTPFLGLSLEPGLRLDWSTTNGKTTVSPRIALSAPLGGKTRLRIAGGLYTQSPGYEKLVQSDYFINLSNAKELGLRHEQSVHLVFGIERELYDGFDLRIEGYYKWFDNLLVGRLETNDERNARLSVYDFPEHLQSSVPSAPLITSNPTNEAKGRAYGFDAYLAHTEPSATLSGWVSYAWGRADRESYGHRYAFEYDRRNAFNAVGRYRLTQSWNVAATARLASGFPYTPPIGLRVAATADHRGMLVPDTDDRDNLVYTVDYGDVHNTNSGKLPLYARLDIRATYQPGGPSGRWSLYLEVINLLNRQNSTELEPRLDHDPTSEKPKLTEMPGFGFPRIPTFGLRFRF